MILTQIYIHFYTIHFSWTLTLLYDQWRYIYLIRCLRCTPRTVPQRTSVQIMVQVAAEWQVATLSIGELAIKYWYSMKLERRGLWENIKYDFLNLRGTLNVKCTGLYYSSLLSSVKIFQERKKFALNLDPRTLSLCIINPGERSVGEEVRWWWEKLYSSIL